MASTSFHESPESLSAETREMHRAIASLIEELEAVDWYAQRIDASGDPELRGILVHNRDEEKEHACMTLEWIRRRDPIFDAMLRKYLFTGADVTAVERGNGSGEIRNAERTLRIGSLRQEERP